MLYILIALSKEDSKLSRDGTRVSWADQSTSTTKKSFLRISKSVKHAAKATEKKKRKTIYKEKRHTIVDDLNERYLVS